jgi:transcription elongation factor Elf1
MGENGTVREDGQSWESVHVCPNCGQVINLSELDMKAITTGIVTCPSCDWSGQIEIQVVDQVPRKKATSVRS